MSNLKDRECQRELDRQNYLERISAQHDFQSRVWNEHCKRAIGPYAVQCELRRTRFTGWVPVHIISEGMTTGLFDIVYDGVKQKIIRPGQHVLDMGSGDGTAALFFAYMGFNSTGIEIHESLKTISEKNMESCKDLYTGVNVNFINDSYYPAEYILLRESGKAIALDMEKAIMQAEIESIEKGYNLQIAKSDDIFHPTMNANVCDTNNLNLKDVDIFYAYVWPIQAPSVAEIFKLYARDDAVLCMIGSRPENLLDKFGLKKVGEGMAQFYLKKR